MEFLLTLDSEPFERFAFGLQDDKHRTHALRSGGRSMAATMRMVAPRGKTLNLWNSIGSRVVRRNGQLVSEVGPNLRRFSAPHAHLVIRGTKIRRNKRGANRGRMRRNDFVAEAFRIGSAAAINTMETEFFRSAKQ